MYRTEEQVARRAEAMLEAALREKTSSFAEHLNRKSNEKSLKDAIAISKIQRYNGSTGSRFFMRSLSIKMAQHGFIQNAGVDTTRSGGSRMKKNGEDSYSFKSHIMKMERKPFINEAVDSSGVKEFVMTEITRLRSEVVMVDIRRILENIAP